MKQKYIVGNWKMTLNKMGSLKLAEDIKSIDKLISNDPLSLGNKTTAFPLPI